VKFLQLKCCGIDSANDFLKNNNDIPGSCCGKKESKCDEKDAYNKGCADALKDLFESALQVLGGVALGIATAEVRN